MSEYVHYLLGLMPMFRSQYRARNNLAGILFKTSASNLEHSLHIQTRSVHEDPLVILTMTTVETSPRRLSEERFVRHHKPKCLVL